MKTGALVIAHNAHDLTERCLDSIIRRAKRPGGRWPDPLVLFDNGSTQSYIHQDVTVFHSPWNLCFSLAVTVGIEAMFSYCKNLEAVILLNNDTEVISEDWLDRFTQHLEDYDVVGLGHTQGHPSVGKPPRLLGKYDYLGFWCVAISRRAWEITGALDYRTFSFYYEDRDWCYRAQDKGLQLAQAYDIVVNHVNNATFDALGLDKERMGREAHDAFIRKWGFLNSEGERNWDSTREILNREGSDA